MPNYVVNASQLAEGQLVLIRGKLGFSRLVSLIDGEELKAADARKVQNGMSPVGRPHTTVTLTQAEVQYMNPTAPTLEEQFVSERRYASKTNPASGPNWSIDNKSTTLPILSVREGDKVVQIEPESDLAAGVDVTLVLRVYKPQNFANRGLSLDQVVVNETPRFYTGGMNLEALAARGIVFKTPPHSVQAAAAQPSFEQPAHTQITADGLAMPAPVAAGAYAGQPQGETMPAARPAQPPMAAPETIEQKLARLEAENAALRQQPAPAAVPAPAGVGSAVAYDPANPWEVEVGGPSGITYPHQG